MQHKDQPVLSIIIPCKDEEAMFSKTKSTLLKTLKKIEDNDLISNQSFLCFVDDGSKDSTWEKVCLAAENSKKIKGVKLSRNFGHQNALMAAFNQFSTSADIFITIDADLQDDVDKIEDFVKEFLNGSDVVYGVREDRSSDTWFKRSTAKFFYALQSFMGIETIPNHADFRLLSQKAVIDLLQFQEPNLFIRGVVPLLGHRSAIVKYQRKEREAGETKYPLKKMISFAIDGITSFSMKPLRTITMIGALFFMFSMFGVFWVLVQKFFGHTIEGWSSLMISFYLATGIQMISLGIIGEYVGKTFQQTKNRPNFLIEETIV